MSYQTVKEVENAIAEQKRKLAELESAKEKMGKDRQTNSETGQLAIFLHSKLCNWNHTDGCSWFYEIERDGTVNWAGYGHAKYWEIAQTILNKGYKCDDVTDIVTLAKG